MITGRKFFNRSTLTKNAEGRIIENLNENISLAVDEVKSVASLLKFSPDGNGWKKFCVDAGARAAAEYVLSIAKTVAEGAHVFPGCKMQVSFHYHMGGKEKMLAISTDGDYGYGAIRVENGFALFMAICTVTGEKPKLLKYGYNCYYCYIELPIRADVTKAITLRMDQRIKKANTYVGIINVLKRMASYNCDGYVLSAHAKDVKLVLAAMSGRQGYANWLDYSEKVYNVLGGPNCYTWVNDWARQKYQVTLVNCCDGSQHIALCSYDANGCWNGGIIWLPGTRNDCIAYCQKYKKRVPILNY